jgi:exopolysaccharide production protein ExoY
MRVSILSTPSRSEASRIAASSNRYPIGGLLKRSFDIIASLTAIVALLPLLVGCCLVVLATSRGPVLFRHRRVGLGGREFTCLKFRTMEMDAERRLSQELARNPEARREWQANHKLKKDPRITPLGQFLRRTSLDELPQLFNVLKGDMSLVGPRPIVQDEVAKYQQHFAIYVRGRPGLTGLWQINGRNTTSYSERVAYDVDYLNNWSLARDLRIIMATTVHVVAGSGAY